MHPDYKPECHQFTSMFCYLLLEHTLFLRLIAYHPYLKLPSLLWHFPICYTSFDLCSDSNMNLISFFITYMHLSFLIVHIPLKCHRISKKFTFYFHHNIRGIKAVLFMLVSAQYNKTKSTLAMIFYISIYWVKIRIKECHRFS